MSAIYNFASSVYYCVSSLFIYGCRGLSKIYKFATGFFQNSASKDRSNPPSMSSHQVTVCSAENEAAFIKRMEGKPGYLAKLVGGRRKFNQQELQIKLGEAKSKIEQYNKENPENPLKIIIEGSQVYLGYSTAEFETLLNLLRFTEPVCPFSGLLFDLFRTFKKNILIEKDYSNPYQVKLLTEYNLERVKKEPRIQDASSLKVDFPVFSSFNGNPEQMNTIFKSLLANHRGFFVGELHLDRVPKQILQRHMKDLYENGVRLLFLEFCCNDTLQGELDRFFEKKKPSPFLEKFLKKGYGESVLVNATHYYPMILAAVEAGIRPVGIEMSYTQLIGFQSHGGSQGKERMEAVNFTALPIIESELQKNPTAKFIGLVGTGHLSYLYDVPGLSELCGVPNLVIKEELGPSYSTQVLNLNVSDAKLHGNTTKTHFCHIQVTLK